MNKNYKKRLTTDLEHKKVSASTFLLPFWVCFSIVFLHVFNIDSREYFGIKPQNLDYIMGVFLAPFAHDDSDHLINNTVPLFFLMSVLIHFFDKFSYKLIFLMYFFTGFGMWFFCPIGHNIIGASGVLYCMTSFLFLSGILRGNRQLMSISLLIVFLYGGMFWGIFDLPHNSAHKISWESHRIGFVLGVALALVFKSKGPQKKKYEWEEEGYLESKDELYSENQELFKA